MWRKCIFLVIKYIRFEDLLDYVHFVTKPLFYRHFAGVQQEPLFQVFVNQVLLCVFSAGLLLKGKVSYDEVRMWSCPVSLQVNRTGVFWVHLRGRMWDVGRKSGNAAVLLSVGITDAADVADLISAVLQHEYSVVDPHKAFSLAIVPKFAVH